MTQTTFPIQTDFSGGVISPRLHGRVDSDLYRRGVELLKNWLITPQGSILTRPGFEYRGEANQDTNNTRLFTFQRVLDTDVIVELNNDIIKLYDQNGQIIQGQLPNQIRNPQFLNGFTNWTTLFLRDVTPWVIDDPEPGVPDFPVTNIMEPRPAGGLTIYQAFGSFLGQPWTQGWDGVQQRVTISIGTEYIFSLSVYNLALNFKTAPNEFGTCTIKLGTTQGGSEIFEQIVDPTADKQTVQISHTFIAAVADLWIEISTEDVPNITTGENNRSFQITGINLINSTGVPTPVEFNAPWPVEDIEEIHTEMDVPQQNLYFFQKNTPIHRLFYDEDNLAWIFEPFAVTPPETGGIADWSVDNGYPRSGAIHKGRLYVGGSVAEPSAIWASEVWEYSNFDFDVTSPTEQSPLKFILSASGNISWIESLKQLLIGTNLSEIIGKSEQGVITTTDFEFSDESWWGSGFIQPIQVSTNLFFVTVDFKSLRALYDAGDRRNTYVTDEISFLVEHYFRQNEIKDLVYAKLPMYQIAALRTDGTMAMCMFSEELNLRAWWEFEGQGEILAITFANGIRGTSIWAIIRREGNRKTLEELTLADEKLYCLDMSVEGILDPITKIVSGLEAHANNSVTIVTINGDEIQYFSENPFSVGANGTVQLPPNAVGIPIAGLSYDCVALTLPPETGGQPAGSSQSSKRRWPFILTRLSQSAMPKINGQRPPGVVGDLTDGVLFFDGDVEIEDLDWDRGQIVVEQNLPLRTEVLALFGKAATANK